ncbi:MAG: hypothetical protein A3F54_03815 [Candidatus Kerfeldbacteria bacterium RIFCSPHIGHO2_12_FULL_48_17]|uniref:Uncharacterized protein n=1 Tax=Candidatus Kerfeldbacteria bacterium RIFCSPHIGHO2_12_FULL_48_17 TaxID=1798542 RepID=A0A1G2B7J6_9BACT|nr:MAG: hypothetical protein A3F54_03815 [Candidatus Kerfeldbacteria bacterium RIFCSPHIGHO2_12_FULL_48_17]
MTRFAKILLAAGAVVLLTALMLGGFFVWYRFGQQDHIIGHVETNALAYFYDRNGAATDVWKKLWPAEAENIEAAAGKEMAVVVRADKSIAIFEYLNGGVSVRINADDRGQEQKPSSPNFATKHLGQGFWRQNLGHYPVYAVVTEDFFRTFPQAGEYVREGTSKFLLGDMSEKYGVRFSARERLYIGAIPLTTFAFWKPPVTDWVPKTASILISGGILQTWQDKTGILTDHADIAEAAQEKWPELNATERIAFFAADTAEKQVEDSLKTPVWAIEWPKERQPAVEQMIQYLAHNAFPELKEGADLPDGTPTKEWFARDEVFPGLEKTQGDISYTLYKKDDWQLVLIERENSVILTNNELLPEIMHNTEKLVIPACGAGEESVYFRQDMAENSVLGLFLQGNREKEAFGGCIFSVE